jgi:hypothetical protein
VEIIEQQLTQWISVALSGIESDIGKKIRVSPESIEKDNLPCVHCLLKNILPAPPSHHVHAAPLQIALKYLIYVSAEDQYLGNKIIEELVFSAMEDQSVELELQPVSDGFWQALNVSPRPSFMILAKHQRAAKATVAGVVTKSLVMHVSPPAYLRGRVIAKLKSATIPLVGASVSLGRSGIVVTTDNDGNFNLGAVPASPKQKKLMVHYKNSSQRVVVSVSNSPVEIIFQTEES